MNKRHCFIFALLCTQALFAQTNPILKGFTYEMTNAPSGNEWESPESLALNKEQPHAYFFSFNGVEKARKVLPEYSKYWKSLNGYWHFQWSPNPKVRPTDFYKENYNVSTWDSIAVPSSWNIYGIQKDGSLKYGVPIYVNQSLIFMHQVKVNDWKNGVMRTPPATWTTYKHRNEVGSFRRTFQLPKDWKGREIFINFDGVDSFFYLWINGQYVGFSKNSRNMASFNITDFLHKGNNTVAVEVYRNSDGSFLEAQDMFRLPGIFRTVSLHSVPQTHIRDLIVTPDLDETYTDGQLAISAEIFNHENKNKKGYSICYSLYANKLYSDENTFIKSVQSENIRNIKPNETSISKTVLPIKNPNKWSAELPYRYTLVAELKDQKGHTIETVSTTVGFREVEIKDTPASEDEFGLAGRYHYINGKPVKLKGVNRHETNPESGHAITHKQMEEEIMLMKRANINHVRNSHYPTDPYWYHLCDKYGIYLEDEANLESHEYRYGKESLSHPKEWENAHIARVMEMAHATINHPSVVIWSLGNEGGPGNNFLSAYRELKKFDTSRPVQYERNNDIVDIGSNQYPSVEWVRGAASGKYNIKYPFHISEYAHSMGNASGNLTDYWEAIESTNYLCGGAIWDWVDQSMLNYDPKTGERYFAYGGDFGDYPNDGQFVMNGIMFGNLTPKPQYYEVKKVYQHIETRPIDIKKGRIEIFNKYYFKTLDDYNIRWSFYKDGREIKAGTLSPGTVSSRTRKEIVLPYIPEIRNDAEYFVKIQFLLKEDKPWAKKGYVIAEEQIAIKEEAERPSIAEVTASSEPIRTEGLETDKKLISIRGKGFEVIFDKSKGTIHQLDYNGKTVIKEGKGPKLDAFRAFVNNDNWIFASWFENGLHNLQHKVTGFRAKNNKDGTLTLLFTIESQAPCGATIHGGVYSGRNSIEERTTQPFEESDFKFTSNLAWNIYKDGSIELASSIVSNRPETILPRLGYAMEIPERFNDFTYYGRGPIDNYSDRKSSQFIEIHKSKVADEFVPFPKPQNTGNHEDVRWCALTDDEGEGVLFIARAPLAVSALPYSALDMTLASHPYQLKKTGSTFLHLDCGVTGLGGCSCGPIPLKKDQITAGHHTMGFIIRPAGGDLSQRACVKATSRIPLSITRNRMGKIEIISSDTMEVLYTIGDSKPRRYEAPFPLVEGGAITAWEQKNPSSKTSITFGKMPNINAQAVYASSEEPGEGNASHLTDGDLNTIWHTMYSVTQAKYPHWVDLDTGEERTLKGITYYPRQDNSNGNVKDYAIYVSQDGKIWGKPVCKGSFENTQNEKKVLFPSPIKARFVRFMALSEQYGNDYASGAEITVLEEQK